MSRPDVYAQLLGRGTNRTMDERETLVAVFQELAELTTLAEENPQSFRVRAYENAVQAIRGYAGDIAEATESELSKVSGVGKSTAKKIREVIDTGGLAKLEELRARFPPAVVEMSRLPGLGPKSVTKLRNELGIESLEDLEKALSEKRIRALDGFGAKSEEKIARAIKRLGLGTGKNRRLPVGKALPLAERIATALLELESVDDATYCGSLRRMRETIGDIDIVVTSSASSEPIMDAFVALSVVDEVLVRGGAKTSILTRDGLQVDLRVVTPAQRGAALLYFTGSKAHNIKLRQRALDRGWTLNEYALTSIETGDEIAAHTEEDIYKALDLEWVPPPMREDTGEVERAADGTLPSVVTVDELRGDCHVHTALSGDAKSPLTDVVNAANQRGYEYLAITDHAENLPPIGVDRAGLDRQRDALREMQSETPDLRLLQGVELNIDPNGELDYDLEYRLGLDMCVAAIHSHFDLSREEQTTRLLRAMEDPSVNVIGHLSSRRIGKRPPIEMDIDAILEGAQRTNTAIEINSALGRLDASSDVLRRAGELGVLFVISSDAHHIRELDNQRFGALHSQRGWVRKEQIINTWPRDRFLAWIGESRS